MKNLFCKIKSKEYKAILDILEQYHRRMSMMEITIEALEQRFKKKIKPNKEEDLKDGDSIKKGGLLRPSQIKHYGNP